MHCAFFLDLICCGKFRPTFSGCLAAPSALRFSVFPPQLLAGSLLRKFAWNLARSYSSPSGWLAPAHDIFKFNVLTADMFNSLISLSGGSGAYRRDLYSSGCRLYTNILCAPLPRPHKCTQTYWLRG